MMSLVKGDTYQAGWLEADSKGRPINCVMTVAHHAPTVWLIGGSEDRQELSDCVAPIDTQVAFPGRDRPEVETFEDEWNAFQGLLPRLRARYPGSFVAIHRGTAVDADTSRKTLVQRFFARFGDVPVYIGYVGEEGEEEAIGYQVTPLQL